MNNIKTINDDDNDNQNYDDIMTLVDKYIS